MALPPENVLKRVAQLSIDEDKPIYLDYYRDSVEKKCCIGVQDKSKFLVKSDSEYTSTIQSVHKCDSCYIVMTENSLYVVDNGIPIKRIVGSTDNTE
jgi:hypothetical protein